MRTPTTKPRRSRLCSVLLAGACGGDDAASSMDAGTDPDATTVSTGTSSATATDSSASDGTVSATTSTTATASTTDTTSNGTSETGVTDTDATGESTSTGGQDESTSAAGGLEVRAFAVPGGLDRIWILARDPQAGTCTAAILVWPFEVGAGPTLPRGWGWQGASISDVPSDCDGPGQGAGGVEATSASGQVGWAGAPEPYPCAIDVDVQLDFAGAPAWVPASQDVLAADVAVEGAPGC